VLGYPRTRRLLPLMATLPLLLSSRSLVNYFLYVAILMLVHASGTGHSPIGWARDRTTFGWLGRGLVGVGGIAAVAATAAFLVSPAPLHLTVAGEHHHLDASGAATVSLIVIATNVSDLPVRPTFGVTSAGFMNPSWHPTSGPAVLPPRTRATYELVSTDPSTTISQGTVYLVDALAPNPDSVSTSDWVTAP
jgi:hypothetical protein